jgi:hypothetical protein
MPSNLLKRPDMINQILSNPSNTMNKTNLKKLKKEDLMKLLHQSTAQVQQVQSVEEVKPRKITRKDRQLLNFEDDLELNDDIVEPQQPTINKILEEPVTQQPIQTVQVPQPVKQKPVLKTTGHIRPTEVKQRISLDDVKDTIQDLIKNFSKLINEDIKDFKSGQISEDELIEEHNNLRQEIEDEIILLTSTLKVSKAFTTWFEKLLDLIYNKVARCIEN